jgi:two-component system sensor histidine kinase QseC
MVDALNGLFERIGALMESERRFTADAAHELRTPIAAIRAQAQVALAEQGDEARRHALSATLEGCDRATRLVEQLLMLSRLEAGTAPATAAVELGALVRRVVAEVAPQALHKGQGIEVDAVAPCEVRGDATLLAVLVRNLVDNAIRYCPANATVRVALAGNARRPQLTIEDSGPGLSEHDAKRLGERFFRVLGSGQSGSGLGWSIVRRIAAVHGAEVRVGRSGALGGLEVVVEWQGVVKGSPSA